MKTLKFSKNYLRQFVKREEVNFTWRKSNQKKISNEQLNELRKPINAQLSSFSKDRVINMDETGRPYANSHQKGSFTVETNMDNFKARCCHCLQSYLELRILKPLAFYETESLIIKTDGLARVSIYRNLWLNHNLRPSKSELRTLTCCVHKNSFWSFSG